MPRRHRRTSATDRERIVADAESSTMKLWNLTVMTLLEANNMMTLREIREEAMEIFPPKPHLGLVALSRYLEGEVISQKVSRGAPAERNSPAVREAQHTWMLEAALQQLMYIEETGFSLRTKRTCGRARRGAPVHRAVGGQRGRDTTVMIAAMSDQCGFLYHEIHFGSVTKEVVSDFIASITAIIGTAKPTLVPDNAPVHNGIAAVYPEISVKFLPPYSPCLNPLENCFSTAKLLGEWTQKLFMCTALLTNRYCYDGLEITDEATTVTGNKVAPQHITKYHSEAQIKDQESSPAHTHTSPHSSSPANCHLWRLHGRHRRGLVPVSAVHQPLVDTWSLPTKLVLP
ncbi:uncharacterized protein [Penaeus vannamei]|uniref:uncharacterized protein n=1 Tax=Penaeus vannamei TaxID=6689 RepID=UPI00387F590E